MRRFIPKRLSDNIAWLNHYASKLSTNGVFLGLTAAQIAEFQGKVQLLNGSVPEADAARANSKKATDTKNGLISDCNNAVSDIEAIMQTSDLYTDAIKKDMGTDSASPSFDLDMVKPKVVAHLIGGGIRLRITKYGAKAVAIYSEVQGDADFVLLDKITGSVYFDKRPLKVAGVAEIRLFKIRIIYGDQEVGYFSDIITISFGG